MPGNDSDDRVHNFFPQDNLLQGRHQQTLEGNWSVANNNFLVGGQIGLPNTTTNNVNIQHSVTDRGQSSHILHGQSGLNSTQTRSTLGQNSSQRQQLYSNGYMFGNHVNQTRQDGSNILAVDTIPDQHNLVSRGLSMYELHQGPGQQHQTKSLVRSETSEYPETFNLFGNQQQMHHPQSSMLQSFQKQQSGFSDMQQLQQQIMWRKMQELQKQQQQLHQLDGRQQNAVIPISPFSKQSTGGYPSAMANSPPRADSQSGNTHLLQHASSFVQGSPNEFVNSANHGQEHSSINLGVQQGNQSPYGDTYSWLRGNQTQFSEITVEKPSMGQMTAFAHNVPANQYPACTEQSNTQEEESMIPRLGFPAENPLFNPPDRTARTAKQMNSMKRVASLEEIHHVVAHSQEKTLSEDVASPNEVSLDPTEARILYGSEDNIWAAFGKSLDDCGDAGSPFDHFQSGTWSALMQSAVAETSSSDVGQQEVLGGPNVQCTSTHSENQIFTHSRREETSFNNDESSPLNPSVPNPDISSTNNNHQNILGVQMGNKLLCQPGQRQGYSFQREGSNISSPGGPQDAVSDVRTTHESVLPSMNSETNQGSYRGPWPPAQSGLRDHYGESNGYNPFKSASHFLHSPMHARDNPSLHSQGFASCPMPLSTAEVEHANSFSGNTPVTRGGFTMSNASVTPCLSTTQLNESNQAMFWRNVNPTIYGSGSMDRSSCYVSPENQSVDSSLNRCGKANTDTSEMENYKRNDSSNNSYGSDLPHNISCGGVKENVTSQQSTDFEGFKAFSQISKGCLDLGKGGPANKKDANGINDTHRNFHGHIQNATLPFNQHVDMCTPVKHTASSLTFNSQNMLELLHKIDQLRGHGLPMHSSPSDSQLPKTENRGSSANRLQHNHNFGLQLGPPSHRTVLPDHSIISQGSLQKKNSSHQSRDVSDTGERARSQTSSPAVQSLPPLIEKPILELNPNSDCTHTRSQFQYDQMVKESGHQNMPNHIQMNDSFSRSSIGQTTETPFHNASGNSQYDDSDLVKGTSNQISAPETHLRGLVFPTSAKDVSVSQDTKSNAHEGTYFGQPHLLSSQMCRTSSNVLELHQPNVLESNSFISHKHCEQESTAGHISPSVSGSSSMNKGSPALQNFTGKTKMAQRDELQRPEPASNSYGDGSPSNSVTMQKDMEAFGRSLMPSNTSHQNYSLLHQMRIIKSAETDPNGRARKRMKIPGSVEECQQLISTTAKSSDNAVGQQHGSVSSGDFKTLSFAELKDNAGSKAYAQHGNVNNGNNPTPIKVDELYINPQMTPSWLSQYGGFRNGRMLTEYDSQRGAASKTAEPPFSHGNTSSSVHMSNSNEQAAAAGIGPRQIGNLQQIPIPSSAEVEPQTLVLNVTRPKKRERTIFQLTSWCKEVLQGSRNPQTISMAEVYWAEAANRLTEKIEDEVKFLNDGLPMLRAKRRITLTTQLMQQLLSPPKSDILNSAAELNYDGVAYSASRLALGEACGLLTNPNSDSDKSHHVVSLFSGKDSELEKVNDRHLSKLLKGLMGRAQKLESDFLRLDKTASLIDVRSECHELEKFSVINRFAKFHGRGQGETGGASSSINGAANALRPYLQRYVTAFPVPRNLPDRVHCLSL